MSPFPHIVIQDFLHEDDYARLKKALEKQHFERKDADLFSFSQTRDLFQSKDPAIQEFLQVLKSKEFKERLYEELGARTKSIDAAGFIYKGGDYLLPHDDRLARRKIAYVMNFSTLTEKDGGALALFASKKHKPTYVEKRIFPRRNTLVLFEVTKDSHHMVEEVLSNKERLTIAGWFHD